MRRRSSATTPLTPIKGQLVVLRPQPGIDYLSIGGGRFSTGGSQYMFPRADGILLGGTFERGVDTLEPDPVEGRSGSCRITERSSRAMEG